jgi:hypothetical protein
MTCEITNRVVEQVYYRFNCINYLGWKEKGMVLAGGCGGSPTPRHIKETGYLETSYILGKTL